MGICHGMGQMRPTDLKGLGAVYAHCKGRKGGGAEKTELWPHHRLVGFYGITIIMP